MRAQFRPPIGLELALERMSVQRPDDVAADADLVLDDEGGFRRQNGVRAGINVAVPSSYSLDTRLSPALPLPHALAVSPAPASIPG